MANKPVYYEYMNTNYRYTITIFVLNTMLHHVGMSCIIETNQQLEYEIDKINQDWIRGGTWYNISICKNYMEQCLIDILEMQ